MAGKKRKESSDAVDVPAKKSRKSQDAESKKAVKSEEKNVPNVPTSTLASANTAAVASKKSRKRAVDFMNDEDKEPTESAAVPKNKKPKATKLESASTSLPDAIEPVKQKAKRTRKKKTNNDDDLLTADGVNGVVEHAGHEDLETATSHQPVVTSLQAEAERTVDHELEEEFGPGSEQNEEGSDANEADDNAAALLAGFDSDSEDNYTDQNLDPSTKLALSKKKGKEVKKKLAAIKEGTAADGPGVVYVGRIPHGFYESQMREYFSQFGDISKLRLSRNRRTGASKHFAFIEFSSDEVAKIVASTMDNYMLFGHLLKCKYAPSDSLHPDVWKGANRKYRKVPHEKLERERLAAPKSEAQWEKSVKKEQKKREKKAAQLASIGIDMPKYNLTSPSEALKEQKLLDAQLAEEHGSVDDSSEPAGLIEPPNGVPKDEVAIKKSAESEAVESTEKTKEAKKSKRTKSKKEKSKAEPAIESAPEKIPDATTETKLSKKEAKNIRKAVQKATEELMDNPTVESAPEVASDFISLDLLHENPKKIGDVAKSSKEKSSKKEKKEKKQSKQAAESPKDSKSDVPSKSKKAEPVTKDSPKAAGKKPIVPPLGKDKYNKAKRQEHKEAIAKAKGGKAGKASSG